MEDTTLDEFTTLATQAGILTLMKFFEAGRNGTVAVVDVDGVTWAVTARRIPTIPRETTKTRTCTRRASRRGKQTLH